MKQIYLDNSATTKIPKKIVKEMIPYFTNYYGNPSEPHKFGIDSNKAIEKARTTIADFIGAKTDEVIFTSCSTESINLAHKGLIEALGKKRPHIITTPLEHKAVLETCKHLNAEVTYVMPDKYGVVSVNDIKEAIQENTVLISVMYVNNEIGTIEPIKEIGDMIIEYNFNHIENPIYFHTDATQALQYLNCNVDYLGVDLMSFTGHKIHAPKGIGALYIRGDTPIKRQQDGGGQEFGIRAGTENVPYIVALGKAVEMIKEVDVEKVKYLRDTLINDIITNIKDVKVTGHLTKRVPHIASFVFKELEGENIVNELSNRGIMCSSGSACTSDSLEPSHVLKSIGLPNEWSNGSVRFSFSKYNTINEVHRVVKTLKNIVNKLKLKD